MGGPIMSPLELEIADPLSSITNLRQGVKAQNQRLFLRWKEEYLKELQKRNKWKCLRKDLEVGDMMVIREDNVPTNEWRLGRVLSLHSGHVRVVDLKTLRGTITRPNVKLVILPAC